MFVIREDILKKEIEVDTLQWLRGHLLSLELDASHKDIDTLIEKFLVD